MTKQEFKKEIEMVIRGQWVDVYGKPRYADTTSLNWDTFMSDKEVEEKVNEIIKELDWMLDEYKGELK